MRGIITAPLARDLFADFGNCIRIPDAKNATLQAWDCIDAQPIIDANDATLTTYTTRATVPNVLKPFLIAVQRSDSNTQFVNVAWKRLADCDAGDYFRVRNNAIVSVKTKADLVAGDKPVDWTEVHSWAGVDDVLGEE